MTQDLTHIADVLRRLLPDGDRLTGVVPLTTGFSNETYLVEGCDLILRLPPSAGAMLDGHDVVTQARIYEALSGIDAAPPVPEVVLVCDDVAQIGVPFFVMKKVPGESVHDLELQDWFTVASDDVRRNMCRDWVSAFASLAHLDPLHELGTPLSPQADIKRWRDFAGTANSPELVDLFDRLLSRTPAISGPPSIVHGDTKLSNLMWSDHKISAVLDWEMSLNGEPLSDLGYMLYSFESPYHPATRAQKLPGMLSREEVIHLWADRSGRSAEGVEWYEIAQIGKICAIIAEGTNMYVTGRSADPKLAYFKQNLDHFLSVMASMLDGHGF